MVSLASDAAAPQEERTFGLRCVNSSLRAGWLNCGSAETTTKSISSQSLRRLSSNFWSKNINIPLFQLLNREDLLLFFVLHDNKRNIFWFWTVGWTAVFKMLPCWALGNVSLFSDVFGRHFVPLSEANRERERRGNEGRDGEWYATKVPEPSHFLIFHWLNY